MNTEERERMAWRTLNDTQDRLLSMQQQHNGRLTPSTLRLMYEQQHDNDVHGLLTELHDLLPELRRRFPSPQNFAHTVLMNAAIGRRTDT